MSITELVQSVNALTDEDQILFFEQAFNGMKLGQVMTLVKHLEEVWDVEAAPSFGGMPEVKTEDAEEAPEQTEFKIVIRDCGPNRIKTVRAVREATQANLKETSDLLKQLPAELAQTFSKEDAEQLKTSLESVGATVELK